MSTESGEVQVRERRGVYYTPEPVVSYIVRSVDHLLKARFGCVGGLASTETVRITRQKQGELKVETIEESSPRVLILDPACGTGSFLYAVISHIRSQFAESGQTGMWSGFVREHLLPRLFGFELLMAPYAVAHFKLGMQLAAQDITEKERSRWAYDFAGHERLGIYLTNTLEEAARRAEGLFGPFRIISEEAKAAARVKRDLPIMVVIGNPPYSGHSANRSWEVIEGKKVPTFIGRLLRDYYKVNGEDLGERNPKMLQDDYVKFLRFGQWRIEQTGAGILAFVTNHSYLDNPTFRGMRQQLLMAFTDIYVLDLHGNTKKREVCPDGSKDDNVFDIQQGVAIGIFVKEPGSKGPARVHHADLWGERGSASGSDAGGQECPPHQGKYGWLMANNIATTEWVQLNPVQPFYLFRPEDARLRQEYERFATLEGVFGISSNGFKTHRDHFAVAFDGDTMRSRIELLRSAKTTDDELREALGLRETQDWTVTGARRRLAEEASSEERHIECLYRPFDLRACYFSVVAMDRPRFETLYHATRPNLCLAVGRQGHVVGGSEWNLVFCGNLVADTNLFYRGGIQYYPLYLYPSSQVFSELSSAQTEAALSNWPPGKGNRRPNLSPKFLHEMEKCLGLSFVPDPDSVGQTFLSAQSQANTAGSEKRTRMSAPLGTGLKIRQRRLPHWILEGSTYFVTFRVRQGTLSESERALVVNHVRSGSGRYYALLAVTVMPDHVHLLLRPEKNVTLSRIMKGLKGVTARRINQSRGRRGSVWQEESWDRIVRDQDELNEKLKYMLQNPVAKGLIDDPWKYDGWWLSEEAHNRVRSTPEEETGRGYFTPEDVFHYIYAVLHSPTYRSRYASFLKIDFPRIPITSDMRLFRRLCTLGARLVALHLLQDDCLEEPGVRYPNPGPDRVDKGYPKYFAPGERVHESEAPLKEGRVYISRAEPSATIEPQYFEGVPATVWEFQIGGYQVCEKWLKDRRGRTLTFEERVRYQKIVAAIRETIRLMAEIDHSIPRWPMQ